MKSTHTHIGWIAILAAQLSWTADTSAYEMPPINVHGLLDVALAERGRAAESNFLQRGDSPFDGYGARLFFDAVPSDHVQVFTQLVLRDAIPLYVDGAYVLLTPNPKRDLHVMAGKIPWPIGTWAPRTYSNKNPLVGSPLMYQYHSTLLWYEIPPDADQLLSLAGTGQYGVGYAFPGGSRGMAVVDDSYWDVGAIVTGSARPFEFAAGAVSGVPGWGTTSIDDNSGKSVLGRLGLAPVPMLRLGVSGSYGPYLQESLNPVLPAGKTANDYHQILMMADAAIEFGHVTLIAEAFKNTWESPTLGDLDVEGGYAEAKVTLAAGFYAAGRIDALRFSDIVDSGGNARGWDRDVDRIEAGLGYRFDRNVLGKVIWQSDTWRSHGSWPEATHSLVAGQLSVSF